MTITPTPTTSATVATGTAPPSVAAVITTTSVTAASSPPAAADSPTAGGLVSVFLGGAVIAAAISALVSVLIARRKSLEEERARVRSTFAEAFEAVTRYKEFPYAIRRRRDDRPAEERVRLSEGLREVQARLSYYVAWTKAESADVGAKYETLVTELRKIAGKACHDAWLAAPAHTDRDMNFPPGVIDLSGLKEHEDAYIHATQQHLNQMLSPRRVWRRV